MKTVLIVTVIIIMSSCTSGQHSKGEIMKGQNNKALLKIIEDSNAELPKRLEAIRELDITYQKGRTISALKKIISRKKPDPIDIINWDPVGAERIVDMYLIETLNKLGEDSLNSNLTAFIAQAGTVMQGPDDEIENAIKVVKSINDKTVYSNIIYLSRSSHPHVVRNAVKVLNGLKLKNAPLGGEIDSILPSEKMVFQFTHFKEEIELYVKASQGKIRLSKGVKEYINSNNYQRSGDDEIVHLELSLVEVVEQNLTSLFDFSYYIENEVVMICTSSEAAKRWQNWTGL